MNNVKEEVERNNTEPDIVYEDTDVVIINKPSGIAVHSDGVKTEPTIVDWLVKYVPDAAGVGEVQFSQRTGEKLDRSGVVHRLDYDTSGVLLLTKHQDAFAHCKEQFQNRLVKKEYRAFVYGTMPDKWGTIDRPIGRSAKDFRKRSAERGAKGTVREAVTDWEVIQEGHYKDDIFSYVSLYPKTGRMHQLRVHCKAIGRPIVGDRLYAGKRLEQSNNLELTRLALHAYQLTITLPSGREYIATVPAPKMFTQVCEYIAGE